jgi:HlyD family secretion protein
MDGGVAAEFGLRTKGPGRASPELRQGSVKMSVETMKGKAVWIGVGLVVVALGAWALKGQGNPVEVEVAAVGRASIDAPFTAEATVKGETVDVEPEMSGRIVRILVKEGDSVSTGQRLVEISSQELSRAVKQAESLVRGSSERTEEAEHAYDLTKRRVESAIQEAESAQKVAVARLDAVLAGPRPQEVAQAELRVRQAEAAEAQAKTERDRAQRLYDQGALPLADLQRAVTTHETAVAQTRIAKEALGLLKQGATEEQKAEARAVVEQANAALSSARANREQIDVAEHELGAARAIEQQSREALRSAQAALAKATVVAPFAGSVSHLPVKVGDLAAPGRPLLTLVGEGGVTIEAEVGDQDFAKVSVGQEVDVTAASLPGQVSKGRVVRIASEAVQKPGTLLRTRILRATIELLEPNAVLRPGMEVDVHGSGVVANSVLVVPGSALLTSGEEQSAWVVEGGVAKKRRVKVGVYTFERAQITEGLNEGDKVVVSPPETLVEGMAVSIKGS